MYIIVGLGNPDKEYEKTNHNIGFRVIDKVTQNLGVKFDKKVICKSLVATYGVGENKIIFAKPQTYMNNSGHAVGELVRKYNIDPKTQLVIVSDDFDVSAGTIRIRTKSGNSTHNGIRNIKEILGTNEFYRVKVSIAPKPEFVSVVDFVLARSKGEEVEKSEELAVSAVLDLVRGESIEKVMAKYSC